VQIAAHVASPTAAVATTRQYVGCRGSSGLARPLHSGLFGSTAIAFPGPRSRQFGLTSGPIMPHFIDVGLTNSPYSNHVRGHPLYPAYRASDFAVPKLLLPAPPGPGACSLRRASASARSNAGRAAPRASSEFREPLVGSNIALKRSPFARGLARFRLYTAGCSPSLRSERAKATQNRSRTETICDDRRRTGPRTRERGQGGTPIVATLGRRGSRCLRLAFWAGRHGDATASC
jgi:hypothetical protein